MMTCAGCSTAIYDKYVLYSDNRYWHSQCLRCSHCCAPLDCKLYTRQGMIFCKRDYLSLFGSSGDCAGCMQKIPASEYCIKIKCGHSGPNQNGHRKSPAPSQSPSHSPGSASSHQQLLFYHVQCFRCTRCGAQLQTGDKYLILDGAIICQSNCAQVSLQQYTPNTNPLQAMNHQFGGSHPMNANNQMNGSSMHGGPPMGHGPPSAMNQNLMNQNHRSASSSPGVAVGPGREPAYSPVLGGGPVGPGMGGPPVSGPPMPTPGTGRGAGRGKRGRGGGRKAQNT